MAIPSRPLARLTYGAGLPVRAADYLSRRPSLWALALVPMALTALGIVAGLFFFWPASAKLLALVWTQPHGAWLALWELGRVALFVALLFFTAVALPVIVAAPFNDRLSARVEALELGEHAASSGVRRLVPEMAVAFWHAIARLAVLALGHGLLLVAALIPVADAAYPALAFLWSAAWLAFEYLDLPMARHLYGFGEVRGALARVRPLSLGFGGVLAAQLAIPLVNLAFAPVGVVAGTLLYCDLVREGAFVVHQPAAW